MMDYLLPAAAWANEKDTKPQEGIYTRVSWEAEEIEQDDPAWQSEEKKICLRIVTKS